MKTALQLSLALILTVTTMGLYAQEHQVGEMQLQEDQAAALFKKRGYSPYAGRNFPTTVFWGDTHLHTSNSLDARAFGNILGPEQAYRLARERRSWPVMVRR